MWLFKRIVIEELDRFQVENLIMNRVPFLFFDVNSTRLSSSNPGVQKILQASQPSSPTEVLLKVGGLKDDGKNGGEVTLHQPMLLICADGKISSKLARKILKKRNLNVYVIAGGQSGLETAG